MSAYLTLYTEHQQIENTVTVGADGVMRASLRLGTSGVDSEHFTLFGPVEDVVKILTDLARAATDAAVASLNHETPAYTPTGPVIVDPFLGHAIEIATNRLACCGAGPDRVDDFDAAKRLHLPGCSQNRTSEPVPHHDRDAAYAALDEVEQNGADHAYTARSEHGTEVAG